MSNVKELREILKDIKVLFVDDEEEIREGTGSFLKKFFNNVIICGDGEEGLAYYKENPVDIVITDVMMPKMDGVTMVREIKKNSSNVFAVFITAFRDTLDDDPSLIDMHIKKPLSYEDMVLILNSIAKKHGK